MTSHPFDVAVIGGGIVGLATAMALASRVRVSLVVLEAEAQLAAHQTGHNSGVIHSGLYYRPGSLKARNCVEGREALYRFCQEHGVAHERCGKIVVATRENELPALDELERRGRANGLTGIRRLRGEEIRDYEPHAGGIAGLHVPETGIVDYVQVAHTVASLVWRAGGEVCLRSRVRQFHGAADALALETDNGTVHCRYLINCGGLQSDRIARMCGLDPGLQIIPFRGEYYELISNRQSLVRNLIYPVPDPRFPFLGVHFTRMIHGGVEAGPNAVLAFRREGYRRSSFSARDTLSLFGYGGFWRMARRYWRTGLGEFYRSLSKQAFVKALQRLIPELRFEDVRPAGAGVRAQALGPGGSLVDDFRIVEADRMIHVLNAPSPAATASLSIGRTIADMAVRDFGL
ncbi:MAG TPA: L-2-hydroxyglutarate oxidase [Anaerolineae bacterium]|nr:L-2-hydroxyglutarate oxidase [Anaerolineae bacterium]